MLATSAIEGLPRNTPMRHRKYVMVRKRDHQLAHRDASAAAWVKRAWAELEWFELNRNLR